MESHTTEPGMTLTREGKKREADEMDSTSLKRRQVNWTKLWFARLSSRQSSKLTKDEKVIVRAAGLVWSWVYLYL